MTDSGADHSRRMTHFTLVELLTFFLASKFMFQSMSFDLNMDSTPARLRWQRTTIFVSEIDGVIKDIRNSVLRVFSDTNIFKHGLQKYSLSGYDKAMYCRTKRSAGSCSNASLQKAARVGP